MRKNQENKFTMYKAVDSYLRENLPIITSIAELLGTQQEFKQKCNEIKVKDDEKKSILKGKAISKLRTRDEAIKASYAVSGGMYAYAKKMRNHELAALTDIQKTSLTLMRDTELVEALEALRNLADAHLTALESFGITQARLDWYSEKVAAYDTAVSRKETGMIRKKGATKSLKLLFEEGDEILKSLDKLIAGLTLDYPEFVRNYQEARFIMEMGIRHKKDNPPVNPPPSPPENTPGNTGGSS